MSAHKDAVEEVSYAFQLLCNAPKTVKVYDKHEAREALKRALEGFGVLQPKASADGKSKNAAIGAERWEEEKEFAFGELFEVINGVTFFRVIFEVEVEKGGGESVVMRALGWLPFIPQKGMSIIAIDKDDFRTVDDVYYRSGKPVTVFLEFEPKVALGEQMPAMGWKEVA